MSTDAAALTLDEVRARAADRSLAVERARAAADAARADAGAVWGGALPALAGFASASTGAGMTSFGFERPVSTQFGFGLTASFDVVDPAGWAAATAARRSAAGQAAMAEWALVTARQEATASYAAAWAAGEAVAASRSAAAAAGRAAEAAEALAAAGLRPAVDAARARAEAATARAALAEAEAGEAARCASLQALVGLDVDGACALEPISWAAPAEGPGEHPALTAASEALGAAEATRAAAAWDLAPTVALSGTAAQYVIPGGASGPGWSAGLTVAVPIFAGGAGWRGFVGDRARAAVATADLEAQARVLQVAEVSARARYTAAVAAVEARAEAAEAAASAWSSADARYQAGLDGLSDWLSARQARDQAALALLAAQAERGAALAALEAARGVR